MADTYCGKDCMTCESREKLNCPGCKQGPGRRLWGDCALAKCCCDKGHTACDSCTHNSGCYTYRDRDNMPERRIRQQEQEARNAQMIRQRAQLMGKWLKNMFILQIFSLVISLLSLDFVKEAVPALGVIGWAGCFAASLLGGVCLLRMQTLTDRYRIAGMGMIVFAVLDEVYELLHSGAGGGWALLFGVISIGFGLVCQYNEMQAHSEMFQDIDSGIGEKWQKLWKWYIISFAATFGSIVLVFVPVLAMLVLIAALICYLVVSIMRMIHLYHSYKACEEYLSR